MPWWDGFCNVGVALQKEWKRQGNVREELAVAGQWRAMPSCWPRLGDGRPMAWQMAGGRLEAGPHPMQGRLDVAGGLNRRAGHRAAGTKALHEARER